jgi:uncharacterized protein with FMN-binding domain
VRRAPYVIAGTVAGIAGVLAFPTHRPRLVIPTQPAATASGSPVPGTAVPGTAVPGTAAPGTAANGTAGASSSPTTVPAPATARRTATGADQPYRYGDLAVDVVLTGSKVTDVQVVQLHESDGRSASIDDQAIPYLRQQVLAAQSTNIDGVSGATYTSQAYVDSVQSALDKLGFK